MNYHFTCNVFFLSHVFNMKSEVIISIEGDFVEYP